MQPDYGNRRVRRSAAARIIRMNAPAVGPPITARDGDQRPNPSSALLLATAMSAHVLPTCHLL